MTLTRIREKAANRRKAGWAVLLVGVAILGVAGYIAVLETTVVGASSTMFTNCGSVLFPVPWTGVEAMICAEQIGSQALVVGAGVALAVVAAAIGIVVLVRTPRYA